MSTLPTPDFADHDAQVHRQALRALRLRRHVRLARIFSGPAAVALLLFIAHYRSSGPSVSTVLPPRTPAVPVLTQSPSPAASHPLTDRELLAAFPPGSCFLAEVNGKKVLVFSDPAIEKQYLQ